jgi:hypothetical protein
MISTWFVKSYFRTKEKLEWLVVPLIVVLAFSVGLLQAVFLGIAMSTFLFVASFFRSGVVKYIANGMIVRSTIERPPKVAKVLDQTADQIQILVLQNYLFFGNASSILGYITSMFEQPENDIDPAFLPPIPKIVILDMMLVTGMDTSAVDAFSDVLTLFGTHNCKLFLAGLSNELRQIMALGGVKPETGRERRDRRLRFFPDLDSAVGKAEDLLLDYSYIDDEIVHANDYKYGSGFQQALLHVDEQHQTNFAKDLLGLEEYTTVVGLEPGDILYRDKDIERGLFFIEHGILKIERAADFTFGRSRNDIFDRFKNDGTLNHLHARTGSVGREIARLKAIGLDAQTRNVRIARGKYRPIGLNRSS